MYFDQFGHVRLSKAKNPIAVAGWVTGITRSSPHPIFASAALPTAGLVALTVIATHGEPVIPGERVAAT